MKKLSFIFFLFSTYYFWGQTELIDTIKGKIFYYDYGKDGKSSPILHGYHKLYNKSGKVFADGVFDNNNLISGKKFFYKNDTLFRATIYKDGKCIGDETLKK